MSRFPSSPHICVCGSRDFILRMSAALRQYFSHSPEHSCRLVTASLGEARSVLLTERSDILVVDIGPATTQRDAAWLHGLLSQIRERFGRRIYVILAVTVPSRFVAGGDMLFKNRKSLEPSGLVDNLLVSPPPHVSSIPSLEQQLINCITHILELDRDNESKDYSLPALWDDGWVPVMCDPISRDIWMRWLPRYAKYVNENPIIVGPTGCGKTRLAHALHTLSNRPGPFVTITPRDFSSTELMQAELFGAAPGAYTGAVDKWGLVKKADRGTLFIDELQSIDLELQGKLITFIENKVYRRVGEAESHHADVRFVFATNRSLESLIADGSLRDDFAYRLERLKIVLGPLLDRRLDISAGICFALGKVLRERAAASHQLDGLVSGRRRLEGLSPDAYQTLFSALWPGNFRQLENTIAKLIELADIHELTLIDRTCTAEAMNDMLGRTEATSADVLGSALSTVSGWVKSSSKVSLAGAVEHLTEETRSAALEMSGGDIAEAARLIDDSPKKLELFAASREARKW